jgi:hypothetical protein
MRPRKFRAPAIENAGFVHVPSVYPFNNEA